MRKVFEPNVPQAAWVRLAEREGLLVIAPNGWNVSENQGSGDQQTWNDLRGPQPGVISEEDDAGFVDAVVERELPARGFDPREVFVVGSSNGGMLTFRVMIEFPERFAAAAPVIANLPENAIDDPPVAKPIVIINGDADPLMPWEGGVVGFGTGAPVRSGVDTLNYWRRVHGLETTEGDLELLPDTEPTDGTRILRAEYRPVPDAPPLVTLYRIFNGGHSLPLLATDPQSPLPASFGRRSLDANGADLAWAFFLPFLAPPGPRIDLDASGTRDVFDLVEFFRQLDAGSRAADLNCDDALDAADATAFLTFLEQD